MNIADICSHLLFVQTELEVLIAEDPDAPDRGPNHGRHEALLAEWATLAEALSKAAPPTTQENIRALAELALTLADATRTPDDNLFVPKDIAEWITLRAVTCAAGKPEAIPLPEDLPLYWPEKAC